MGGLSRKQYTIKNLISTTAISTLLLDAGNSMFKSKTGHTVDDQEKITAATIMKIYKQMGYTAVNVGSNDVIAGIPFLVNDTSFPWVSCSYYDQSHAAIFHPFYIQSMNGFSVGITGISARPLQLSDRILYKNWQDVLPEMLKMLRENCDFIILLSELSSEENKKIIEMFPSIRILISSEPSNNNIHPQVVNNALLTQTEHRGRFLGFLTVANREGTTWQNRNQQLYADLQQRLLALTTEIGTLQKNSPDADTVTLPQLNRLIAKRDSTQIEIGKIENQLSPGEKNLSLFSSFNSRFIPLKYSIPEDEGITLLLKEMKNEIVTVAITNREKATTHTVEESCQQTPEKPASFF